MVCEQKILKRLNILKLLALFIIYSLFTISKELKKGIQVEKEHKNLYDYFKKECKSPCKMLSEDKFYGMIADAHIKEDRHYYDKLQRLKLWSAQTVVERTTMEASVLIAVIGGTYDSQMPIL